MSFGIGDVLRNKEHHLYKIIDIVWDSYECGEPFYRMESSDDGKLLHIRCAEVKRKFKIAYKKGDLVERFDDAMGVLE